MHKHIVVLLIIFIAADAQFKDVPKYKGYLGSANFENIDEGYRGFTYNRMAQEKIWNQFVLPKSVPILGVYDAAEDYPFLNLRYLIDVDPQMIKNNIPVTLVTALEKEQVSFDSIQKIYAHIVFYERQPSLMQYSVINVIFHHFYWQLSGRYQFRANLLMGLFNPVNVKPAEQDSISFNKFNVVKLDTHPGELYRISPNNARFEIVKPPTALATFWLAAVSPDKKQISISYVIVMNQFFSHLIIAENSTVASLKDFLNLLLRLEKSPILSPEDHVDLKRINSEIRKIVMTPVRENNLDKLVSELNQLQNQLIDLMNKLNTMSSEAAMIHEVDAMSHEVAVTPVVQPDPYRLSTLLKIGIKELAQNLYSRVSITALSMFDNIIATVISQIALRIAR